MAKTKTSNRIGTTRVKQTGEPKALHSNMQMKNQMFAKGALGLGLLSGPPAAIAAPRSYPSPKQGANRVAPRTGMRKPKGS